MDEAVATLQRRDLVLVVVDADHPVTDLRETNGCHQPNVPRSHYCYLASIFHPTAP
jgi:hypothetical protein